jgi:hypothetical protein
MIIWINGPFGAGNTTLSERLRELMPDSFVFDPEYIGYSLRHLVPDAATIGDFQDLPIWRSMTLHALCEARRLYQRPIIVPMTLVNPAYLDEIHGGLIAAGVPLVHVFLDIAEQTLRQRLIERVLVPENPAHDQAAREWGLAQVDRCLAARALMPSGTHVLDSGVLDPAALAKEVMTLISAADKP